MDFKHSSKNGNSLNGTYANHNSHNNQNHPQQHQQHHHSPHQHISNIDQHEMYNNVKHSPSQKGRLRRRCRSECLSPISGQYHHNNSYHGHHHHQERYNLRTHHHSNYYTSKEQDYINSYTNNCSNKPNHKYYTNPSPVGNNAAVAKNGYSNSSYSSYLGDNNYDSSNWKENLMGSGGGAYDQVYNGSDKKFHSKMQVDGIKSVQFERQMGRSGYHNHQQQQQQGQQPQDFDESYYRNSYYRMDNRRYRARSESESYDLYYHPSDDDHVENFRNDLKRGRESHSPPMLSNKAKYEFKDSSSVQSIPFTRSINNKSVNSSPSSRHSVLVNNHINNYNRFSPKLKPRSPLNSYRNKIRALTPLSKQKAMLMRGNFRHKSLSPTLLKSGSPTMSRSSSGRVHTPTETTTSSLDSVANDDQVGDDNDADSRTLDDEDCDNEDDDEPEPPFGDTLDEDLTDPEDNYESSVSLASSEKSLVTLTTPSPVNINCVLGGYIDTAPLAPSLFPFVPPYITFASYDAKGPEIPPVIQKQLKWKLTTITPILVRKVLFNTGFRLIKKPNDWIGTWGKHMKSPCFKTLHSYQKFNHLPGSFQIGRKDRCWRNLQTQMSKHGKKEFGFMPRTYIIPQDLNLLRQQWHKYSQKDVKWIIKPPASARGTGIRVVNTWASIPKRKPLIVQRYIERPLLINGSKFDLRLYVLVTSINPLRVYMHTNGLARFASVKYSECNNTLNDRYMHLTNYSINKLSNNYDKNEDADACKGHKWTIKSLWAYLAARGIDTDRLWGSLRNLVLRTVLAGEGPINAMSKVNMNNKYNCFELFGIDVLLDAEMVPWLLEVNISPSLHSASPLDMAVKGPLVTALLNTVLYQIPPKIPLTQQTDLLKECGLKGPLCYDKRIFSTSLSKEERHKHNQFTQRTVSREDYLLPILENLTPDDIRCLIITEDELNRCAPLERIFPAPHSHKYLQYTESPRYYNHLVDAWEHRFSRKREAGIAILRALCWKRQHLKVPPTTIQKDCNGKDLVDIEENEPLEVSSKSSQALSLSSAEHQRQIDSVSQNADVYISDQQAQQPDKQINTQTSSESSRETEEYIEEDPIDQVELELMKNRYLSPASNSQQSSENSNENQNTLNLSLSNTSPTKLKPNETSSIDPNAKCYTELISDALPIPNSDVSGENLIVKKSTAAIEKQPHDIAGILVKQ